MKISNPLALTAPVLRGSSSSNAAAQAAPSAPSTPLPPVAAHLPARSPLQPAGEPMRPRVPLPRLVAGARAAPDAPDAPAGAPLQEKMQAHLVWLQRQAGGLDQAITALTERLVALDGDASDIAREKRTKRSEIAANEAQLAEIERRESSIVQIRSRVATDLDSAQRQQATTRQRIDAVMAGLAAPGSRG